MRSITKKAVYVVLVIAVVLLALGALPSLLKSGDPYYLTAAPTDETLADENATVVDATNLSDRTYRYTWEALRNASVDANGTASGDVGRSDPYWKGPFGLKEAFTHSPFDEMDSLRTRYSATMVGEREALVRWENQTYRLALTQP